MKKLMLMAFLLNLTGTSFAQTFDERRWTFDERRWVERVSLADSFFVHVDIEEGKVRCSALGYGMEELKIEVPDLRSEALFNHANFGEAQPCMTAGICKVDWVPDHQGFTPADLIQDNPAREQMLVERELVESFDINITQQKCQRRLRENLKGVLRGIEFKHTVAKSIGDLPIEVCLEIENSLK